MRTRLTSPIDWAAPLLLTAAVLWLLLAAGCERDASASHAFSLALHASTPAGEPLSGVRFFCNGNDLGVSDAQGRLAATIRDHPSDAAAIAANCPPGYQGSAEPRTLHLRPFNASSQRTAPPLALSWLCTAQERTAALVVRALLGNKPLQLPIRVDDEPVSQTSPDGIDHLLLPVPPDSSIRVALDTAAYPRLRPPSPVRAFQLSQDEDVILFDVAFTESSPRKHTPAHAPPPTRRTPYKIQ